MMGLVVRGLQKSYTKGGETIAVLQDIELEIAAGESLAVIGSSGVGKSTLLHSLGLLDRPDAGSILLNGEALSFGDADAAVMSRRRHMGFIFQFHYLMAELSALENVLVPLWLEGLGAEESVNRAKEMLNAVGLSHRLHHRPSELSGGEQQRVAIARALVHRPKMILADEPTGNLDPQTANAVFEVLTDQCKRLNSILIMATHNFELADRLQNKRKLVEGRLRECD